MIEQLKITNFRSIYYDVVRFDSPITIIIGANGTGKTNLILALRFISSCVADSPVRAIQKAGGLDKVFSVRERRAQKCSFEILLKFSKSEKEEFKIHNSDIFEEATYSFELKFDDYGKILKISNESIRARKEGSLLTEDIFCRKLSNGKFTFSGLMVGHIDEVQTSDRIRMDSHSHLFLSTNHRTFSTLESRFDILLNRIFRSLGGINGYNFDPQAIRKSSDLLSSNELSYDGKGFSSLIYRILMKKQSIYRDKTGTTRRIDSNKLEEHLKSIYEDVLPFLHSFKSSEAMDATTVDLIFTEEQQVGTSRSFTAQHLSDGTLKFLAIVISVLILPQNNLLFLEELENYLNPRAIRRILELMRNQSEVSDKKFILTTHSETVLNQMRPNEILISRRINDGGTKYSKFKEVSTIESAIDESGVSLGTFWGKGGLDAF